MPVYLKTFLLLTTFASSAYIIKRTLLSPLTQRLDNELQYYEATNQWLNEFETSALDSVTKMDSRIDQLMKMRAQNEKGPHP
jgi:hypothetical protein